MQQFPADAKCRASSRQLKTGIFDPAGNDRQGSTSRHKRYLHKSAASAVEWLQPGLLVITWSLARNGNAVYFGPPSRAEIVSKTVSWQGLERPD
ncbi:MAG: hypothetical protein U0Z53_09900 [Blastocatellia bacterium]